MSALHFVSKKCCMFGILMLKTVIIDIGYDLVLNIEVHVIRQETQQTNVFEHVMTMVPT